MRGVVESEVQIDPCEVSGGAAHSQLARSLNNNGNQQKRDNITVP